MVVNRQHRRHLSPLCPLQADRHQTVAPSVFSLLLPTWTDSLALSIKLPSSSSSQRSKGNTTTSTRTHLLMAMASTNTWMYRLLFSFTKVLSLFYFFFFFFRQVIIISFNLILLDRFLFIECIFWRLVKLRVESMKFLFLIQKIKIKFNRDKCSVRLGSTVLRLVVYQATVSSSSCFCLDVCIVLLLCGVVLRIGHQMSMRPENWEITKARLRSRWRERETCHAIVIDWF